MRKWNNADDKKAACTAVLKKVMSDKSFGAKCLKSDEFARDAFRTIGEIEVPKDAKVDEGKLKQVEAIINSMTNQERRDHNVIDGKRRKRIAKGSGTTVQDVNQVLKQYLQMRTMMKQYGAMAARAKMKGLGKLAGLS